MLARLATYLGAAIAGIAAFRGLVAVTGVDFLAVSDVAQRSVGYQTLAGVAVALLTVHLAALVYFLGASEGSRMRRVLEVSNGAIPANFAATATATGSAALAFSCLIFIDRGGDTLAHEFAAATVGVVGKALYDVIVLVVLVLSAAERDASSRLAERRRESEQRFAP